VNSFENEEKGKEPSLFSFPLSSKNKLRALAEKKGIPMTVVLVRLINEAFDEMQKM